ncbi:hypothetical protein [Nocardioides flavescens]|uniref:Uncharacterized protein n=1 Tax=Nocardioides flavescens TaxID=2691959 RepID=A0A6L7F3X3_9ACTN|nr:hypothetical protein [Nocardioides flavescens]MXG91935.1 hypothetical protein [Nocardioides flavescens]
MHDHDAPVPALRVDPPLTATEIELLAGLAGWRGAVRRVLPPQPTPRSPWVPCRDGCCLRLARRHREEPAAWLRWLVREVLDPRAAPALRRAGRLGLAGGHAVGGEIPLAAGTGARLVVRANRVHEVPGAAASAARSTTRRAEVRSRDDDPPA